MISHQYKCIFIHIPKCAGTSIESALGHLDQHSGRDGQDHRSLRMLERPSLKAAAFNSSENVKELLRAKKHQYLGREANPKNKLTVTAQQYRDYYKFTVVRNPWARAFSWYNNVMRDEAHIQALGVNSSLPFKVFLQQFAGKGLLRPQVYWLKNFDGDIPMDYIARFENLAEDTGEVFSRLGLGDVTLPHRIRGENADYREHYDEDLHELMQAVYGEDIATFGYAFDDHP